jgi:hypothetical protein
MRESNITISIAFLLLFLAHIITAFAVESKDEAIELQAELIELYEEEKLLILKTCKLTIGVK